MIQSLRFASSLAARLRKGRVTPMPENCYRVAGKLDIGAKLVSIEVSVPWDFQDLRHSPPLARCLEAWMKTGAEWHNGPLMCWVLEKEWSDAMSWAGKSEQAIIDEGLDWFINNVCCLINRHYLAHREGYTKWLDEWDYWPHGKAGARAYGREQHVRKHRKV